MVKNNALIKIAASILNIERWQAKQLLDGTTVITSSELLKLAEYMEIPFEEMDDGYRVRFTIRADELRLLAEYNKISVEELLKR